MAFSFEDWKNFLSGHPEKISHDFFGGEEWQISKQFMRDTLKIWLAVNTAQATGSQRYAQIAPSAQDEQKVLALPYAINSPILQDDTGLIFFQADLDMPDDPCHPLPE